MPEELRGYAAAREHGALLALDERGVLAATGPKRQGFLHGILSNVVDGLAPGEGSLAALLDVKGHVQALMRVVVSDDAVRLELRRDRLAAVEQALVHYRVAAPVRFAVEATAVLAVLGPRAGDALARLGLPAPERPQQHAHAELAGTRVRVVRASDLPANGFALHVPASAAGEARRRLLEAGCAELERQAFDALRLEDGRPLDGVDVTTENLLHETGLLGEYHSPAKGCYLGQEVVARLEGRGGNVSRALRRLRLSQPVESGTSVTESGREVGRVTSAAFSPRLGALAFAYLHRSAWDGPSVEAGAARATVEPLAGPGVSA
jgi:folate-binding protein YgfZ